LTYLGPTNLIVFSAKRCPDEWTELATRYQNEGLEQCGDPFDMTREVQRGGGSGYAIRLRHIHDYP